MGAAFRLETTGGREIEVKLGELARSFGDLEPLMADIGLYLESATIDRFDTETAPDGSAWDKSIRAKETGGKTLSDSGQLRGSITSQPASDHVVVGTNKIYAGIHQYGGTIRAKSAPFLMFELPGGLGLRKVKEVEMPARPFLGLSAEDQTEVVALAEDYAQRAMGPGA